MFRRVASISSLLAMLLVGFVCAAGASSRTDDVRRIQKSAQVFQEIMATPDRAIPRQLVDSAKCIAIIPGEKQAAFIVGGKYGKGVVTCRTARGWSAPAFLSVAGGSYGFQIGGSSTDVLMIFKDSEGVYNLLSDKFRIGASATAAAGPVGRDASAATDIKLHAEILSYARSRGAFAGVNLNGAVVQPDDSGNAAMYGSSLRTREILSGHITVPRTAHPLIAELERYSYRHRHEMASNKSGG
jgi:SH3 domain-containing YSC84-like protein 1